MKKAFRVLTSAENIIMILTFVIMVLCSFAQVINRNIFKLPIAWFDEASTYCMIYMALMGTELGLRDGTQVAVTAVVDKFKGVSKKIVELISKGIVLIFSVTVLVEALKLVVMQIQTGQTSAALHISMAVPYAALVVSFGMIVLVQGAMMAAMIMDLMKCRNGEEEENGWKQL